MQNTEHEKGAQFSGVNIFTYAKMIIKMKNDEKGALFIEAAIVLPIFMIAMLSFVSLTSLYIVHSKMQYAITQTANEVATYSYFYSYLEIKDVNEQLQQINTENMKSTDDAIGNIADIIDSCSTALGQLTNDVNNIQSGNISLDELSSSAEVYSENLNNIKDDADSISKYIDDIIKDPKMILKWVTGYLANSAIENAKAALGSYVLYPALTYKYLGYEDGGKEAFLEKMGITNMDFSSSSLLPQIEGNDSLNNRIVDVVVTYDYKLPFSILPAEASTFHIVQRAVALGWGDGDNTYSYPS